MRRLLLIAVSTVLCLSVFVSAEGATTPPVTFPSSPKGLTPPVTLPATLDATPKYVPQISCQPSTPPGVTKLRALVLNTYGEGGAGNTARKCNEGTSEHADGRAWDWMVNVNDASEKRAAGDFLAWLTANHGANAKRLGIMYVIYNKKIWAVYRESDGWRESSGHTDHIHISFSWNGTRGNTSFWTGSLHPMDYGPCRVFTGQTAVIRSTPNTKPCPATTSLLRKHPYLLRQLGSKASTVVKAQAALKVKQTKVFDAATRVAVRTYQLAHDLPITGTLDVPTWASLFPSQATSDVTAGYTAAQAAAYGLANYSASTLKIGSVGKSTKFLQSALGMRTADRNGYFGAVTEAAVKKLQADHGREQTGIAGKVEWEILASQ
ncbi:peptidoglycan-binding domain-containing protein [Aeromicrobium sp.]|uniref:peptidoglycan-binding domain-containing protein n=1 Tax=Aeromicrobium sp. TaxID=1871063 RepID=UPI002FC6C26C